MASLAEFIFESLSILGKLKKQVKNRSMFYETGK
jgi:hypothetical protein